MSIFGTANLWMLSGQDELAMQTTEGLSVTTIDGQPLEKAQVLATWLKGATRNNNNEHGRAGNMRSTRHASHTSVHKRDLTFTHVMCCTCYSPLYGQMDQESWLSLP